MLDFPHSAPDCYSYEFEEFKRNVIAIWIVNSAKFSYNDNQPTRSIWGFYNSKTRTYYAPVNHKTVGKQVSITDTSPYSAMIPKKNPLTAAFV